MIERLDVVEEPRKEWELRMEIAVAPRAGAVVATLRERRGPPRRVHPGPGGPADRLGRAGGGHRCQRLAASPRCSAALLGRIPLEEGNASLGPGVVVGEVDQARGLFLGDEPLVDAFRAPCRICRRPTCGRCSPSSACARRTCRAPAATLSPGERTRAALALLQAAG